jgi:hypothetical protein
MGSVRRRLCRASDLTVEFPTSAVRHRRLRQVLQVVQILVPTSSLLEEYLRLKVLTCMLPEL